MNLRVDLILESEQRSASVISMKFLTRMASILFPAIIGLLIAVAVLNIMNLGRKERTLRIRWTALEPKKKEALATGTQLTDNIHMLKALQGWPKSRLVLHEQLEGLLHIVPAQVQLVGLNLSQRLDIPDKRVTARLTDMAIQGKALGENSESNLQLLSRRLRSDKPYKGLIGNVTMKGQRDTDTNASKDDRVFTVQCTYNPMKFVP